MVQNLTGFNPKQGSGGASALPLADYVDAKSLAANTNEDITVPARAHFAMFSATADFYAKRGGTAAVPGDVADGTASQLNPYLVAVEPGDVIGLVAPATTVVTISYFGK